MPVPSDQSTGNSAGPTESLATAQNASSFEVQPSEGTQLSAKAQQEIPSRSGTKHIQFIDALRGLAALSIIAYHLCFLPTTHFALSDGLLSCIQRLSLGVPLFFMISGLTLSLSESRSKRSNFLAFLARRFFRIYPLYLVVLSLMLTLGVFYWHSNFRSWSELLLDISLLFNFFPGHEEGFVWASWSLSVEMIFYLLFPFVFARLRSGYRAKIKFLLCALALSALTKSFIIPLIAPPSGEVDKFSHFLIFNQLPFFAVGICLYGYLFENAPKRLPGQAKSSAVWLALFILLSSPSQSFWMRAIYLRGIGLACLVLSMAGTQKHLLVNPITVYLGKISYSLYLLHVFVIVFIFPSIRDFTSGLLTLPGDVWYLIHLFLVVSITAAIATATYQWLELPFIRLGSQIAHQISSPRIE